MAMKSSSLQYWRDYFNTSSYDVFDVIEHAVLVAASDFPEELKLRRDRITELLFSSTLSSCSGCDQLQLTVPDNDDVNNGGCKSGLLQDACDHQGVNNFSNGKAKALNDEIEEVLRIKKILLNNKEESDLVLYESLKKLQLMSMTVDILKSTEIGKLVSSLRKHGSQAICGIAKTLYISWKKLAEEWIKATTVMPDSEGIIDSVNPSSLDEEEGLPSPPLDEAFLATQTGSMDFSQISMDDDGTGKIIKSLENGRKSTIDNQNIDKKNGNQVKKQVNVAKLTETPITPADQDKLRNSDSGRGRPPRIVIVRKQTSNVQTKQKGDNNGIQKSPTCADQDKLNRFDEAAVQMKLEETKRKLEERYQQVENAKRQRTIQVMDLKDLPNLQVGQRKAHMKHVTINRKLLQGRQPR